MLDNSVVQQHHFIVLRPDRSCEFGLSNNVIFQGYVCDLIRGIGFNELMTRL